MKVRLLVLGILASALLAGCGGANGFFPILKPTSTPTATATPTPTPAPTATPTPTPTPTPVPAARVESGDRAFFNGDWDSAISEYQTAFGATTDAEIRSAALLGLGRTYLNAGNIFEAVTALEQLITEYPDSPHTAHAFFFLGQAYSEREQYPEAAQAFLEYLARRPGVVDAYVLNLRGDALFAAADYAGAAADYQAAVQSPSLLDGILIQMKAARSYALAGDVETALALYDSLYFQTNNDNTKALIDLRKGQAYLSTGQAEQAMQAFLDAVNNYPTAYESYSALLALVEAGIPVNELNRGLVDYFAGEYGVAIAAFERYLQNSPADPGTAHYYYGMAARASGNYPLAITQWDLLIQGYPEHRFWDDAWEQKAYTQWAFQDQYTAAVETLVSFVAQAPGHARAGEFLFDAAQVAERSGNLEEASRLWERTAAEYPAYELANRAIFLAGIARYRLQNYDSAMLAFQGAQSTATQPGDRAAAYLWIGKCQNALGQTDLARASWEQAASLDPTGYYSERARDLLRGRAPFTPPGGYDLAADLNAERAQAEAWMVSTFALPEGTVLSGVGQMAEDLHFRRGAELWELGLYSEARTEFEQLRMSVLSDPVKSYQLANYLAEIGLYRSATLAARQVLDLAGMSDAETLNAPRYFNRLRFGTYFSDLIIPIAQENNFHPLFIFSLVRQESMFEAFVRSSAAANGLMQIIPATGEEIAANLGWPENYTNDDLYRPIVSINFGIDYLDTQRRYVGEDLYAMLAAYNGGPGNAMQWQELANGDPDLFLEVVRFSETRNYIRAIYKFFNIYRRIYDRTP